MAPPALSRSPRFLLGLLRGLEQDQHEQQDTDQDLGPHPSFTSFKVVCQVVPTAQAPFRGSPFGIVGCLW